MWPTSAVSNIVGGGAAATTCSFVSKDSVACFKFFDAAHDGATSAFASVVMALGVELVWCERPEAITP